MDGIQTLKALIAAAKHLVARSASPSDDRAFLEASRLVAEAGVSLERLRRVGELQEMLVEVTALVAAGVDRAEVDEKLTRATWLADDLAVELGAAAASTPPERARGVLVGAEDDAPATSRRAEPLS